MNLYIDESGSINNHSQHQKPFVIAIIHPHDTAKLKKVYKRFVSKHLKTLQELDAPKVNTSSGKILRAGNKMFSSGKFVELKGSMMNREMKFHFLEYFTKSHLFDVYFIHLDNPKLTDIFCKNTARAFNFSLKLALQCFFKQRLLPDENCHIQLDERNEKTGLKHNLQEYLNTELNMNGIAQSEFFVEYFDSSCNNIIQVADVFANIFYSNLLNGAYTEQLAKLKADGILRFIFKFPM